MTGIPKEKLEKDSWLHTAIQEKEKGIFHKSWSCCCWTNFQWQSERKERRDKEGDYERVAVGGEKMDVYFWKYLEENKRGSKRIECASAFSTNGLSLKDHALWVALVVCWKPMTGNVIGGRESKGEDVPLSVSRLISMQTSKWKERRKWYRVFADERVWNSTLLLSLRTLTSIPWGEEKVTVAFESWKTRQQDTAKERRKLRGKECCLLVSVADPPFHSPFTPSHSHLFSPNLPFSLSLLTPILWLFTVSKVLSIHSFPPSPPSTRKRRTSAHLPVHLILLLWSLLTVEGLWNLRMDGE